MNKYKQFIQKYHDFYNLKSDAPLIMREFGWFSLTRWAKEGCIKNNENLWRFFEFDEPGQQIINELGWCEAAMVPEFEERILEDKGEYELVFDKVGRLVKYFKDARQGYMPEFIDHPVKDIKSWEENIRWRLDCNSAERYSGLNELADTVKRAVVEGKIITEQLIGGYMYLRSLIGPQELLYKFYDEPDLIHSCMKTWLELCDGVLAKHQSFFDIDELFLAEDICYNASSLISHDMIREFLFPYYSELISKVKTRNKNKSKKLYIQIDTDGHAVSVIDLYKEIGVNYMSPFEVASGCDVVEIRKKHPDLLILGGFDKRILAEGKTAIDYEIDRIMPFMKKHGGYIPTCDHGVPEEVHFEDYMHFRKRLKEFST